MEMKWKRRFFLLLFVDLHIFLYSEIIIVINSIVTKRLSIYDLIVSSIVFFFCIKAQLLKFQEKLMNYTTTIHT